MTQSVDGVGRQPALTGPSGRAATAARWLREAGIQLWLAGPLAFALTLNYALVVISLAAAGGCGADALAAAGLASSLCTSTGRTVMLGLSGATDTLASQAAGAGRRDLLGLIFRRSVKFLLGHCVPITLFWLSSFLWLPRLTDPTVGALTARYLTLLVGDLAANGIWRPMSRILVSQRISWPQLVASIAVVPLHWALTTWMVAQYGILGAAAATSISGLAMVLLMAALICVAGYGDSIWGGAAGGPADLLEAGATWEKLAGLAYPGGAMRVLESWGFSGMVAISALLPAATQELDVMGLSLNIYVVLFMIFVGLSQCTNTRVGNSLGEGCAAGARFGLLVSLALVLPLSAFIGAFLGMPSCINWLADIMHVGALDADIRGRLQSVFQIVVFFFPIDGIQTVLSGAIRAAGKQNEGARICLLAYGLGIPSAAVFAFGLKLGSVGLWIGMGVGPTIQGILYGRLLWRLDWEGEAAACVARLLGAKVGAELIWAGVDQACARKEQC